MRQRHLERILSVHEPWVVPFVVQLTSEYVIQILETVEAHLPTLDPVHYSHFIRDNQAYFQTTEARMISYWDCYYRRLYKPASDYVGFAFLPRYASFTKATITKLFDKRFQSHVLEKKPLDSPFFVIYREREL